jgi:hypothetical protein
MLLALAPLVFSDNTSQEEVIFEFGCSEALLFSSHGLGSIVVKDIVSLMSNQTGMMPKVGLAVLPVPIVNMTTQAVYLTKPNQQVSISPNTADIITPITIKTTGKVTLNPSQIQTLTSVMGGCEFVMNVVQMAVEATCKPKPSSKYSVPNSNMITTVSLSQDPLSKININPVLLNNESAFKVSSKSNVVISSQLLSQFNAPVSFVAFRCSPSSMTSQVNIASKPTYTKQLVTTNVTLNSSIASKVVQKVTMNQGVVQLSQETPKFSGSSSFSFNAKLTGNTNIAINSFAGLRWQGDNIYPSSDVTPRTQFTKVVSSNLSLIVGIVPSPRPKISIEQQIVDTVNMLSMNARLPTNISSPFQANASLEFVPILSVTVPRFNADADLFMNTVPVVSMISSFEINSETYMNLSYHPVIRHFVSEIVETKTLYVGSVEELFPVASISAVEKSVLVAYPIKELLPVLQGDTSDRSIPIFEYKEV